MPKNMTYRCLVPFSKTSFFLTASDRYVPSDENYKRAIAVIPRGSPPLVAAAIIARACAQHSLVPDDQWIGVVKTFRRKT